jgi:undecaprenyl-diphosphatase
MVIDINLLIIFFVTFISAYITLNLFINFINKISFTPFVIYRILLGLIILSIF